MTDPRRATASSSPPAPPTDDTGNGRLEWLVLGYDFTSEEVRRVLDAVLEAPVDLDAERRLLEIYANVRTLNRPHAEGLEEEDELGSPQEHLHAFLRSLDASAEGLPDRYVAGLERALAHFGIEGLDRTEALEEAAYRLFLSQSRAATAREALRAILGRHLEQGTALEVDFRSVLDRLETVLEPREPALAELAREVRWRCCDEPGLVSARETTYDEMAEHLSALSDTDDASERERHLAALVDCPQPLAPLLSRLNGDAGQLVEAMTRRYYRIRELEDVEQETIDGVPFVRSAYEHQGTRYHVAATLGEPDDLPAALKAAGELAGDEELLVDVYVARPESADLARLVADAELPAA